MQLLTSVLSVIAPHECLACSSEGSLLCVRCMNMQHAALPRCYRCHGRFVGFDTCTRCREVSPLQSVAATCAYKGIPKQLIWKLKFGRAAAAAQDCARAMAPLLPIDTTGRLLITHVPTATSRERQRGYDQAALMARAIARRADVPYTSLLR
ncbi:MAG TPA: hypothetical protein VK983_03655, partial [Candidatus Limnocylindrales bacterium]|nr:hypothetical protein [Candidatus Limnocylindrales bacterium]